MFPVHLFFKTFNQGRKHDHFSEIIEIESHSSYDEQLLFDESTNFPSSFHLTQSDCDSTRAIDFLKMSLRWAFCAHFDRRQTKDEWLKCGNAKSINKDSMIYHGKNFPFRIKMNFSPLWICCRWSKNILLAKSLRVSGHKSMGSNDLMVNFTTVWNCSTSNWRVWNIDLRWHRDVLANRNCIALNNSLFQKWRCIDNPVIHFSLLKKHA